MSHIQAAYMKVSTGVYSMLSATPKLRQLLFICAPTKVSSLFTNIVSSPNF